MKVLVIYHKLIYRNKEEKSIVNQLSWALEKKLIEDIVFIHTADREGMEIIDFTKTSDVLGWETDGKRSIVWIDDDEAEKINKGVG